MSEGLWITAGDGKDLRVDRMFSPIARAVIDVSDQTGDPSVRRRYVALNGPWALLERAKSPDLVYRDPLWRVEGRGSAHERAEMHAIIPIGKIRQGAVEPSSLRVFTADDLARLEQGLPGGLLDDRLYPVGVVAEVRPGWEPSGPAGELRILDAITEHSARHLGALMGVESSPSA